jgi:hypothetical protein
MRKFCKMINAAAWPPPLLSPEQDQADVARLATRKIKDARR